MVGGVAAAVVVLGAVLIPFLVSGNHAKTATPPPTPATKDVPPQPPVNPPQPPVQNTKAEKSPPSKPGRGKQPKGEQSGDTKPEPRTSGKCDLTESEVPKTLDRAVYYLHACQLEEAQAQYERVVGCPAAHERAQTGLQLVKRRIAARGSSGP